MEELIDVLTPDGLPTGVVKPKSEVHRDGDWHRATHLWIFTPGRLALLQRRAHSKDNWPDWWDVSVAGHISAGEDSARAAVREAAEEIGIELQVGDLVPAGSSPEPCVLDGGAYVDNEIHDIYYTVREVDPAALTLDAAEVAEVVLVPFAEVHRYDVVPGSLRSFGRARDHFLASLEGHLPEPPIVLR